MIDIHYRPARVEDLPILYEFEQGIIEAERPFDPTLKDGHINYYDLKELIESDDAEVLVAEVNSKIVGSGYVKIKKASSYRTYTHFAYVGFMFVLPEFRRNGISQMIIKKFKTWAKQRDLNEIQLDVYCENRIAVAAYEKIGFKQHLVEMRMEIK